jgi:N utilization substance protein B
MARPSDIRRLALVALFQFDAIASADPEQIRAGLEHPDLLDDDHGLFPEDAKPFSPAEADRAFALATGAWEAREAADAETASLAPEWPPSRQPAVDRAILRLAHYEMTSGVTPPKAAVNEAVELAKAFSTDRSPAFINGLLGKVLKRLLAHAGESEG